MEPPDEVPAGGPERFWKDLHCTVQVPCNNHEQIDDALRAWLGLVSSGRDHFLQDEDDLARCSRCLLESPLCAGLDVRQYVRTQIVYSMLQEDESGPLHAIANYLLLAGRHDESVFAQMIEAGCFARLVELIKASHVGDRRLHRLLLELMYEMACIERVRVMDLLAVDDSFVSYLFQIIEDLSDDIDDPYHFPVIRVLLVLNEQYMVAATSAAAADPMSPAAPLTNRVVKILSLNGPLYRTFGENIILLLNRATETALQLLILKLLYLLFTTHTTYEYFYTNDLRVLLDVIIRNLLDLPNESASLRHTYLRVLYPLLAHTQLNQPPHYKRDEILRVLAILSGSGNVHFAPADETTLRLVDRVSKVEWLDTSTPPSSMPASPTSPTGTLGTATTFGTTTTARTSTSSSAASVETTSSILSNDSKDTDAKAEDADRNQVVNKFLGISLSLDGRESRASVDDVAAVKEKPGVKTPSRKAEFTEAEHRAEADAADDYDAWAPDAPKMVTGGDDSHPIPAVVVAFEPNEDLVKNGRTEPTAATPTPKGAPPAVPPERKGRAKRVLPAVPTHRHGVLVKQNHPPPPPPPPTAASAAAGKALAGVGVAPATTAPPNGSPTVEAHPTAAAAAAAAHTAHAHSRYAHPYQPYQEHPAGAGIKKLPPKLPPPRRAGRLKQAASSVNLQQQAAQELGLDGAAN
ncbi:pre-rRNA processing [Sporothrix curviconia]|uniref:Pre-rRNA processing n=1 Tax=Sporothrix curviconia TaxID=1260050 RepID=A0ABP0ANK1_9PEZI